MSKKLVSVLLPVRDAEATLDETLSSLCAQTLKNIEIIAVEHLSKDSSLEILRSWAKRDSRIKVFRQPRGSLLDALNKGLKHCEAKYIARADADDISLAERLSEQLKFAEKGSFDIIGCKVSLFSAKGIKAGYKAYEEWVNGLVSEVEIKRDLFVECPLPHPGWFVKKQLFEKLGGYQEDSLPEDYHFLLRAVEAGAKIGKTNSILLKWRDHVARHSRIHDRYHLKAFFALKARFLKLLFLKGRPCIVWGIGGRARMLVKALKEEGVDIICGVRGIDQSTARTLRGAPVVGPDHWSEKPSDPIIACVGTPGAREEIREWAGEKKMKEAKDYVFAN